MEPRIQYAKTKDGVSIAFYTLGEGEPFIYLPVIPFSHVQIEWQIPLIRRWYERLAKNNKLIRYDSRGSGLSGRDVSDLSLDAYLLDLEAVVERLGLESFGLMAAFHAGPVAITYTIRHAELVSRVLLWCSYDRNSDVYSSAPQMQALRALRNKDWTTYTETVAHTMAGWARGDEARRLAELLRESTTQQTMLAAYAAIDDFDVKHLLQQVRPATLVLQRRQIPAPAVDMARRLASGIPDARLVLMEGDSLFPQDEDDLERVANPIAEFLGEGEEAETESEGLSADIVHTILFTDVEGSTALTQRLGDARAREVLRQHERMVREALKSHRGSEVKTLGDGFMASFSSATKALECAIAMQRAFAEHNESAEEPIKVRVGLNAGEPIAEDDDLFGTAVIEAARITSTANGGEILVANVVRELAKGKDFLFADVGERQLKGFDEPVRLFEVRWREEAT